MDKKILLVEDEYFISYLYKKQFEICGYTIDVVESGTAGLEAATKSNYDLILLDIMLPGMNGIDVLKALKADGRTSNIPVILLTNLAQDSIMEEAFKLGIVGYWIKADYSPLQIVDEVTKFFQKQNSSAEQQIKS